MAHSTTTKADRQRHNASGGQPHKRQRQMQRPTQSGGTQRRARRAVTTEQNQQQQQHSIKAPAMENNHGLNQQSTSNEVGQEDGEQSLMNGPNKAKNEMVDLFATDLFPHNLQGWEHTQQFLEAIVQILLNYIREENDRSTKVLEFHQPEEMAQLIDLHIPREPIKLGELLHSCYNVLRLGVRTGHPRFFNQISCGLDLVAMAGEWLTATSNTNMFTYEISPVFILMEKEVTQRMIELIGWPNGGDAVFSPGGAIANMYAMNAARHYHFPRAKSLGMTAGMPTLCCFTSEDSHYSIKSASAVLGIGADNCFNIAVDDQARMIPEALEECIIKCKDVRNC